MTSLDHHVALRRMEYACRQTRHQIDMIERQIIRKMTALIPSLGRRRPGCRRGRPPERHAFLSRYRTSLAAITAERQPELDALSRKLARQEVAIASLRARAPLPGSVSQMGARADGDVRRL
uniref:Orf_Bo179 n=2 Tax=Agrobacterium tumefaciens TaxID=358 RepID=A5WY94_AGRTU|nr:orf_Bo179 [Agrobacterium tumefaciens]